ncbi:hypothetical protein [Litorihabitans aurantiacus]|uniref:Repeat domain-containing protein n=1 Tax=Litorihabitans aurantiacus TaxID=1930061 RepID=A0AA37UGR8_9MICO|nr:hypothetical protein [Litorihabitans aurantiacus]GMA30333.1 hypothetical protein GCM10025875_03250 [Litorihabitans aurantiacus]
MSSTRTTTAARTAVLAATAALTLGACSGGEGDATASPTETPTETVTETETAEPTGTTEPADTDDSPSPSPTASEEPAAFDPAAVDLASATWTVASAGWTDAPQDVTLAGGTAPITMNDWEGQVELVGEPLLVDLDGDGAQDVVAALAFSAGGGPGGDVLEVVTTNYYAWHNTGDDLVQVPFALESSGECADGEPTFTPSASGTGVDIDQLRLRSESACAEGPTVPVQRTVVLEQDADGVAWPVQTAPHSAWGGDCPALRGPSSETVDGVVAPGIDTPVAPDNAAVGLQESYLDIAVPGWRVSGWLEASADPIEAYSCGWGQPDASAG